MSSPYLAEFLVEGVVMLMVASVGVVLNIIRQTINMSYNLRESSSIFYKI